MGRAFAAGTKAIGYCDRCGFQYLLSELRSEVKNLEETDIKACPQCWDPDQPQSQLGRHQFSDPQALRNPRPVGGTSGRDLDAAYREDFSTGTAQTSPTRIDGWWVVNGTLTWTESSQSLNLVGDLSSGDPYIYRGYNGANDVPDYLSIDTSIYKYVVTQFTVNSYPLREQGDTHPPDAFQGQLYWGTGTEEPPDIPHPISEGKSQKLQRAPYLKITQPSDGFFQTNRSLVSTLATNNRNGGVTNVYVTSGTGSSFTVGEKIDIALDDGTIFSPTLDSILAQPSYDILYLSEGFPGIGTVMSAGNAITQVEERTHKEQRQREMASTFKIVWDLTDNANWTGTVTTLRLDYFDARPGDLNAGDIDIDYIEAVAFHNINL